MKLFTVAAFIQAAYAGAIARYGICDEKVDTINEQQLACASALDSCCTVFQKGYAPTNICLPKSTSTVAYDCGGAANVGATIDEAGKVCFAKTDAEPQYLGLTDAKYVVAIGGNDDAVAYPNNPGLTAANTAKTFETTFYGWRIRCPL